MLGGRASGPPPGLNERHWTGSWRQQAACLDEDPELFYSETSEQVRQAVAKVSLDLPELAYVVADQQVRQAKLICSRCPVREQCLEVALVTKDQHGIWGGMTPAERRDIGRHRCLWCGAPLVMWRPDRKYCGPTCANRYASRERAMQRLMDNRSRHCVWCGGAIPPTRRGDSATCSRDCNTRLQNKRGTERRRQRRQAVSA
jgi:WhiB family transcriptional regulator, redox-sensing transcriptional regulator